MNSDSDGKRYTLDEIYFMLEKSQLVDIIDNIPGDDIKSEMISFISGQFQFIYNMTNTPDFKHSDQSKLMNFPDPWHKGYNAMVAIYQQNNDNWSPVHED